jgi:hypothetical protein
MTRPDHHRQLRDSGLICKYAGDQKDLRAGLPFISPAFVV